MPRHDGRSGAMLRQFDLREAADRLELEPFLMGVVKLIKEDRFMRASAHAMAQIARLARRDDAAEWPLQRPGLPLLSLVIRVYSVAKWRVVGVSIATVTPVHGKLSARVRPTSPPHSQSSTRHGRQMAAGSAWIFITWLEALAATMSASRGAPRLPLPAPRAHRDKLSLCWGPE